MTIDIADTFTSNVSLRALLAQALTASYRFIAFILLNDEKLQPLTLPVARVRLETNHFTYFTLFVGPTTVHHEFQKSCKLWCLNRFRRRPEMVKI